VTSEPPLRDDEIAAILARLKDEVYGRPASRGQGDPADPSVAREEAERMWPVSADRPFLEPPGARGRARGVALRFPKSLLRRLMRWYVEPAFADQRRFNAAVLRLLDELSARQGGSNDGRKVDRGA
jgi:hypothetical protein